MMILKCNYSCWTLTNSYGKLKKMKIHKLKAASNFNWMCICWCCWKMKLIFLFSHSLDDIINFFFLVFHTIFNRSIFPFFIWHNNHINCQHPYQKLCRQHKSKCGNSLIFSAFFEGMWSTQKTEQQDCEGGNWVPQTWLCSTTFAH